MIINGTIIKEVLLDELLPQAKAHPKRVCFVQFGNDAASHAFVAIKMKAAAQLGVGSHRLGSKPPTK